MPSGARPVADEAVRLTLSGHVQGVGFRPFVYRLACRHGIRGSVQNRLGEVEIVAVGGAPSLRVFQDELIDCAPPLSRPAISHRESIAVPAVDSFDIVASSANADAEIFVPPDYFMCDDCRRELGNREDRRYGYPFINCTQCGPRYTLIEALPYDRPNTSMAAFPLCGDCEKEYLDPADRRFHAEAVACERCGPAASFECGEEPVIAGNGPALAAAVAAIRDGHVVAVKGIGGYHLVCDACDARAVRRLRERKHRPDKPLAVMFPVAGDDGLEAARRYVSFREAEAELAAGPVRPIVLANAGPESGLAAEIAPGLAEIGVFLPYSPLHQLLLDRFGGPLVATSGNISGEPVLTDNAEAAKRLDGIADAFLQHDRPIVRPADDPVFRHIAGRSRPLRIGRGCAPREMQLPWSQPEPLLAVGGHMKGTIALSWERRVVVSPHIGEMDSPRSLDVFEQLVDDLQSLYGVRAERIVCDAHHGYTTHKWARRQADLPVDEAWHHEAHASAVAAEFDQPGQWLIFTWDGVGLGRDGSLWGGEALLGTAGAWRRVASMRPFRLPGGERAGREPWRSAAALHWECGLDWRDSPDRDGLAKTAWERGLNAPQTSAVGRLFDAAAALICEVPATSFEAQGPMLLEALCTGPGGIVPLPVVEGDEGLLHADWQPLLEFIADGRRDRVERAEAFHSSMADTVLQQALLLREKQPVDHVGLSGGVFQNRVLAEQVIERLEQNDFNVWFPEQLPCNDAALSFGQAAEIAARRAGA